MKETGVRNGAVGADKFGFDGLEAVHWNLAEPPLYEFAIRAGEAELAYGGALCADTGVHTGRSPKDKFIVRDELSEKNVWWDNNGALTPAQFQQLYQDFIAQNQGLFNGIPPHDFNGQRSRYSDRFLPTIRILRDAIPANGKSELLNYLRPHDRSHGARFHQCLRLASAHTLGW